AAVAVIAKESPEPKVAVISPPVIDAVKKQAAPEKLTSVMEIVSATWQPAGDGYRISLLTPISLDYEIDQQSDNQLDLLLESVGFSSVLPALPKRLLQEAHLSQQESNLLLTLKTDQQVRFQIYSLKTVAGQSLNIELHPVMGVKPQASPVAVKTSPEPPLMVDKKAEVTVIPVQPAIEPESSVAVAKLAQRPVKPLVKTSKTLTPALADRQMVRKASELVRKQRVQQAEMSLQAYLKMHPEAVQSRRLLASLWIGKGQFKQASMLLDEGLKRQPSDIELRKLKARVLLNNGQPDKAVQLLQDTMPALSDDLEFHQLRAAALQSAGQHQQASQGYYQLLQLDSSQPSWWMGLGLSLQALQQSSKAREAYRNVISIPGVGVTLREFARQRIAQLAR
ncbi:MAG: tetratricopeptide repeat protein, partial [Motiliproteus sp.]